MNIEGIEDIFEQQARINRKKRNLQRRDDQTAADWLALAEEYKQIDSRANYTYCVMKAEGLGATVDVPRETIEEDHQEEWWNK